METTTTTTTQAPVEQRKYGKERADELREIRIAKLQQKQK
jgi:hypothetical protein